MTEIEARIEQFRKMTESDPNNELGHFSLGRVLLDSGNAPEAAKSFQRVIALNPNLGKVYQLLAQAQLKQNQRDYAIDSLRTGIRIASRRGDLMPKNDMLKMLKDLDVDTSEFEAPRPERPAGEGEVQCTRCGQVKPKMPSPPFNNSLGREVHGKVCADCWREWIGMGTKVINELRLPLSDPQAQKVFDQHMIEFLNLRAQ
jgi:Fe-S cluster biosynthesis and repair protein YggX